MSAPVKQALREERWRCQMQAEAKLLRTVATWLDVGPVTESVANATSDAVGEAYDRLNRLWSEMADSELDKGEA